MPELPEVETIARALRPCLVGRCITRVRVYTPKLRTPLRLGRQRALLGCRVLDVRRRAKFLLVELAGNRVLVIHLGMTGKLRVVPAATPRQKHEHVVWTLDDGQTWRFEDARRFGLAELHGLPAAGGEPTCLHGLGPEPLGTAFDGAVLRAACRRRTVAVKAVIMDPKVVVGVGNIYASEALFRAGIRPSKAAARLTQRECAGLAAAIKEVLAEAITYGGTTISDFASVDGSEGRFWQRLAVYDRAGERCQRCRAPGIRRTVIGGRSTYYCPHCQR